MTNLQATTLFLSDVLPINLEFIGCKGRYSFPIGTNCKMVPESEDRIMIYFAKEDVIKYQPWASSIYLLSGERIGKFLDRNQDGEQFAAIDNYLTTTR